VSIIFFRLQPKLEFMEQITHFSLSIKNMFENTDTNANIKILQNVRVTNDLKLADIQIIWMTAMDRAYNRWNLI
jgi:hypothetical protein